MKSLVGMSVRRGRYDSQPRPPIGPAQGRGGGRVTSLSTHPFPSPSAIGALSSDAERKVSLTSQPPLAKTASAVQTPPAAISTQVAPSSSKAVRLGRGTLGRKCVANLVQIADEDLHPYDVKRALKGVRVELTHRKDVTKRYKVTGVSSQPISQLTSPSDDTGSRLHVVQYFWERYDINLKFLTLPALQAGSDAQPVYLPMEKFNPTPLVPITVTQANQIERTLVRISSDANSHLPDFTGSYGKIKRVCETELGLISQCCQPMQAVKCNEQYLENVASLKINLKSKAGGSKTVLHDAIQRTIPYVTDRPTIIYGADVTRPQTGEDTSPSIAVVLAGMAFAQCYRDDIKVLEPDKKSTMNVPIGGSGMIRDGVSEGQFSQVLLHEIDAIRRACASLEEKYLPPITFMVVVQKMRLFPGMVVDSGICNLPEFDYYLCSHAVIQGPPMYYAHLAAFHAPGGIQGGGGAAGGGQGAAGAAGGGHGGAAAGAGGGGGAGGGAGGAGGGAGGAGGGQGGGGEEEEGEGEEEGLEEEGEEEALEGEGGFNIYGLEHYPDQQRRQVNRRPPEPKYNSRGCDGKRSKKSRDRMIQDARDKKAGGRNFRT